MKHLKAVLCMVALLGSAGAIAQTNATGGNPAGSGSSAAGQGTAQGVQPGKVPDSMSHPQGAGSSPQGSLLQKREQGMSTQGESAKGKTGEMKQ